MGSVVREIRKPVSRLRVGRRGLLEVLLIIGLYLMSELSRGVADGGAAEALEHAESLVRWERGAHLFVEANVQRAAHHVVALPTVLGYAYMTVHVTVTAAVLLWVYRHRSHAYRRLRNTLLVANSLAIVGYALFPTAPPRLAGVGIADTVSGATSVNLTSNLVSSFYNPYAAVPSMHMGFSLIVGLTVARLARRRAARIAALVYPLVVLFVIVATGNHFFLDAAAGAVVVALAGAVVTMAVRLRPLDRLHRVAAARRANATACCSCALLVFERPRMLRSRASSQARATTIGRCGPSSPARPASSAGVSPSGSGRTRTTSSPSCARRRRQRACASCAAS